jgi:exopolysaccharide biosynthesis polyprenyl glycosylphosphotransferase
MTTLPMQLDVSPRVVDLAEGTRQLSRATERRLVVAADALVALATVVLTREPMVLLAMAVAVVYWYAQGLYSRRFSLSVLDDLGALTLGGVWGVMAAVLVGNEPRAALVPVLLFVAGTTVARAVAYQTILRLRAHGRLVHRAVIIGAGLNGVALTRRIAEHPQTGLQPVGFLDDVPPEGSLPLPLLGRANQLASVVTQYDVTDVIVAYGRMPTAELVSVLRTCHRLDVSIYVIPRLFEMHRLSQGSDHVWGIPLVPVRQPITRAWPRRVKRLIDIVVSALALFVLSPVIAAVALAVRWDLGPGIIFEQKRVGLDGEAFTVRKFRSMKHLPPGTDSPWSVTDGDRFGHVGKFIRRFSLDETPQLLNVLNGDMSLVGPRPERPQYVDQFSMEFPRYGDRHRVQVGLTGLAAVEGLRGDTSIEDRAYFDNLYIENWSLWLDMKILARTVFAVLKGTGG